jgi:hypothetical protein
VASADGVWTCWSPRFPEEASMPGTPGYYTYSSDAASILTREPLIPDLFRYVQFEVSLYNDPRGDGAGLTVPRFDEFRIDYDPALPPKPVSGQLELFPNPARDMVNVRFQVDPAGAEVKARIYNVAAHLVSQDSYNYLSGGIKQEAIRVEGLSAGAYVIVLEALGHGGGPGFYDPKTGERVKRIKAKFVVRR